MIKEVVPQLSGAANDAGYVGFVLLLRWKLDAYVELGQITRIAARFRTIRIIQLRNGR